MVLPGRRETRRDGVVASPCGCRSLLGDRHRDPLAALGTATAEHLAATTRLLASAETVRALSALVVWLIGTLHGISPAIADRDRYSTARTLSTHGVGSSKLVDLVLRGESSICYVRQVFSCGQLPEGSPGGEPEEAVDNFWIGCSLPVTCLAPTTRKHRTAGE